MEKDLRCSHNPIDLDWSDGCVVDPHCGISLQRRMASLWKRWVAESAGGIPSLWPSSHPKLRMVSAARLLQPPIDSTTSGLKDTPTEWQASALAAIFRSSSTERAWP